MQLLSLFVYQNPIWRWLLAGAAVVVAYLLLRRLRAVAERHLTRLAAQTATPLDDRVVELFRRYTPQSFLFLLAVFAGLHLVALPPPVAPWVRGALLVVLFLQAAVLADGLVRYALDRGLRERGLMGPESAPAYGLVTLAARGVLWVVVLLTVLRNLGVDVTALVAGLGVAGVAVALAVQNILGDLFASLSILLDKPFVVGDFIVVDDYLGTVEHIGIKTTRVRSLSGEQLVFANTDLLRSRIRNYKRMQERRVVFTLGVVYHTPYEKLRAIPGILREIVEAQAHTRFDRAHFARYGDFSLLFEVVYYVTSPDYNLFMDVQQAINLEIFRRFGAEGIEFAFPTRTLHLAPAPEALRHDLRADPGGRPTAPPA